MARLRTPPTLTTLVLQTSISVLSLNMFLPSLGQIAQDFDADYALVSLALGGYLTASAVLQLFLGPISDRVGRRPVMLVGIAVFVLASIGCALAENIWVFLGFRMLQCVVSVGMVLARAVVRDMAPPAEAARLLAIMGSAMALAPLLGPVLGGVLDEAFGWRANFWVFALMGVFVVALSWGDMGETNQTPSSSFSEQFRTYPELIRAKLFWAYCALLVFSVGGFYAFLGGAPQVGTAEFGLTPGWLGVGMGSISAGFLLGSLISARMAGRWGILRLILVGRWIGTLGPLAAMGIVAMGIGHPTVMFGGAIFVGLGNGLSLPGANAGVMSVAPRLAGSASGLSGALTLAGGAAITTLVGALVSNAFGVYVLLGAMALTGAAGLAAAHAVGRWEAANPP